MKVKHILTVSESAKYLGISTNTLYRYLKNFELRNKLGAYKLAGNHGTRHHWRFKLSNLKLFREGNRYDKCAGAEQTNAEP